MLPESIGAHPIASSIEQQLPGAILEATDAFGELTLITDPANLSRLCELLKREFSFEQLSGILAWTGGQRRRASKWCTS